MPAVGNAATATCAICGTSVRYPRGSVAMLCGSLTCIHRHAAMPTHHKCRVCTTPLAPAQMAAGVCADRSCREEWLSQRPQRLLREAWARRIAGAAPRRDRAAAQRGVPLEERASWRVAVLPRNPDRSSVLPKRRRTAFEAHLRKNLAEARLRLAAGAPVPASPPDTTRPDLTAAEREAESALLGAGCAACRGSCCRAGRNHAFNTSDTMLAYLHRFPAHDDETIVATWLSYLQPRTMTTGCVYQVHDGCSLPRDLRGDTCNAFFCDGLNMIRNQYAPGDAVRAYFVHSVENTLTGGRFVQIAVRR